MDIQMELRNVRLGYGGKPVLPPLSLTVCKGDFLGIVGPNGAGKTTVLKALLGIVKPLSGRIVFTGKPRFGYVPQQELLDELFPLSAREIVMMGRYPLARFPGRLTDRDREAVDSSLRRVEIADRADIPYRELSGGQKQRALIARALAANPQILVLDEPTNGMDIVAESSIMEIINSLNRQGLTIIMVSHLLNLVAQFADTLLLINREIFQGPACELLTEDMLSKAYSGPVKVTTDPDGRKVIYVETGKRGCDSAGDV